MLRAFVALACFVVANAATATAYVLEAQTYGVIANFTAPCGTGPCANYTAAMQPTGVFQTASPLPPNLSFQNILPLVTAYSFTDGVNTYASNDPNVRAYDFAVETDPFGNVLASQILLELWETGTSPHAVGDRVSFVQIAAGAFTPHNNLYCAEVGTGGSTGTADLCTFPQPEASSTSDAVASAVWRRDIFPPVPASSAGGLALLSALVLAFGIAASRMRRPRHDS